MSDENTVRSSGGLQAGQKRGVYVTVAVVISFILAALTLFLLGLNQPRILTADQLKTNGVFLFENPRSFKEFSLLDYNNQSFDAEQLQGKWSLVFFGFTFCPDVCPTTLALLNRFYQQQQQDEIAKDLQIILVSVDPARDTPEKLFEYVRFFNKDFIGLTGPFLDVHRFATQLNTPFRKVPGGGENYSVEHSANIAIINPQGHYIGFFRAPLELAKLNSSYRSILALRSQ